MGNSVENTFKNDAESVVRCSDSNVPGTRQITKEDGTSDVVLVPQPSSDPNDPLNWSRGRKYWHMFVILFWCFIVNAAQVPTSFIAWTSPAWATWVVDLNTTYTDLSNGEGILVFLCAFGCLVFQPYALKYGRRLPYVVASAFVLVGLALGLAMKSIAFFYAYTALSGFGSGPVVDIMFLHQRGTWLGIYCLVLLVGNFLPPVAAGYIVDSQGWQWCFKYLLVFMSLATLLLVFGAEETLYVRDREQELASEQTAEQQGSLETTAHHHIPTNHQKATYVQRMTLFRPDTRVRIGFWAFIISPFRLLLLPAIVWASVMLSLLTFMTSVVFTTQARALGLMYFAVIIGMVFGTVLGGPFSDWIVLHLSRRNGGIMEPEYRLWAYLPVSFWAAALLILYGDGASYGVHWIVPCIGLTLIGLAMNAAAPVSMAYAFDCYNELSGETVQLTNFLRNAIGGAMTFVIQPWNTSITIAVLMFVLNLSSDMRIWTAGRYRRLVEKEVYY
ncbi:major facilitator superfamily domain-containing protein [Exophiala viscosa]|uniref:major facilitator superfamily domain-containing protein n=1 Tax=Exophiala viscosa TaxID=2486360 RepID=UPI00219023A5|nr:major facilitator superfamily domain-containing protein [Exophiala viscosa]